MPEVFAISGAPLGAASDPSVKSLQVALWSLGNVVGDPVLKALAVDGLIGPKTTAATNRALTVHIGSGQAAAMYRTGQLSQGTVAANAQQLAQIVTAEVQRRGGQVQAPPPKARVPSVAAQYTPPGAMAPTETFWTMKNTLLVGGGTLLFVGALYYMFFAPVPGQQRESV